MLSFQTSAQVPYPTYTNYTFEDGLSSQTAHASFQDKDGFMWFATNVGVTRFDGDRFERLSVADGLCDDEVRNIAQDKLGRIWFLTQSNCLSFYENGTIYNKSDYPSLDIDCENLESSLFYEDDLIYIGGLGNEVITISNELKAAVIDKEAAPPESFLWMDLPGLSDNPHVTSLAWCDSLSEGESSAVHLSRAADGKFTALTSQGIVDPDESPVLVHVEPDQFEDCKDAHRVFKSGNTTWLTSRTNGVYAFDVTTGERLKIFNGRRILHVLEDRDNNLWFCTESRGVSLIPASQQQISTYRAAANDQTLSLSLDTRGNVVAGTSTGLVILFNGRSLLTQFKIAQVRGSNGISKILVDSLKGDLWCGGDFGLLQLQNLGPQWFPLPKSHTTENIVDMVETHDSRLIISMNEQLKLLDLKTPEAPVTDLFNLRRANALTIDDQQNLWFAQGQQLMSSNLKQVQNGNLLLDHKITSMNLAHDGSLVIGTSGAGIQFYKDKELIYHLTEESGLNSIRCKQVFTKGETHYLASDKGVVVYEWDGNQAELISNYTHQNGLPSEDIYDVLVKDSLMYLATSKGLVIMSASHIKPNASPPLLHWNSLSVGDSAFNFQEPVELAYNQSYINITYTGISYDEADDVEYQYKLKDSDKSWISTRSSSLEFPFLEAGDYHLQVRGKKHNSDWSSPIELKLSVLPPFYATWWFRGVIVVLFFLIVFAIFRFFERRKYEKKLAIMKQEQAVLEERNRISADMHDDLGSELTNIVILSRIATSQLGLQGEAATPIQKIDTAATGVISKMNEIIWALNPANDSVDGLANYLQRYVNEFLEFHDLGGRMTRPENIPDIPLKSAYRRSLFLIVKEFLQNVSKYAKATRVELDLSIENDQLKIVVTDNGIGFDEKTISRGGNGLNNMRKRASDLGGTAKITSSPGNGTSIHLYIPLNKDHAFA